MKTLKPIYPPIYAENSVGRRYSKSLRLKNLKISSDVSVVEDELANFSVIHGRLYKKAIPARLLWSNKVPKAVYKELLKTSITEYNAMVDALRNKTTTVIARAALTGRPLTSIVGELEALTATAQSNAARLGGAHVRMYNMILTKAKHKNLDITHGIWSTSGDKRVRPEHAARNGLKFSLDIGCKIVSDPRYIFPAITDYGCRCTYKAILPLDLT